MKRGGRARRFATGCVQNVRREGERRPSTSVKLCTTTRQSTSGVFAKDPEPGAIIVTSCEDSTPERRRVSGLDDTFHTSATAINAPSTARQGDSQIPTRRDQNANGDGIWGCRHAHPRGKKKAGTRDEIPFKR